MSGPASTACVHATVVAIKGDGVMLVGPSGAGKSDLALRLIDRGAVLVSDDYAELSSISGALIAAAPPTIAGRMEIRGLGIVEQAFVASTTIKLVVSLGHEADRMPEPRWRSFAGIRVHEVVIDPFMPSAPIKVEYALRQARRSDER